MKILVAYDGSDSSEDTLDDLRGAGLGSNCEVLVLTIADLILPPPLSPEETFPPTVPDSVKRAHARSLEKLRQAEALAMRASEQIKSKFPKWTVYYEAAADSPAWAIIKKSDEWKPDLIVMGARGLSAFGGRLILGSVSQRVLYEASCSVRIARESSRHEKPVRILIGVDNSPDSMAAVKAVCERIWPKGSEVALVAVVDTVMEIPTATELPEKKWVDVSNEENWGVVREIFEPSVQQLRSTGLHAEVLIRKGNPADQILMEARTWGADCIFVGAKGTRGIDRLLLGSVSSAVAARAFCSVEVVRQSK